MTVSTMAEPFPVWLQRLMDERGTGNNKLARYLGVGRTTVSRWRSGEDIPDPPNCYKIATYFERDAEEVLARAGHLQRSDEEIRRLAWVAQLKAAQRLQEETGAILRRLERELFGGDPGPPGTGR